MLGHCCLAVGRQLTIARRKHPILLRRDNRRSGGVRSQILLCNVLLMLLIINLFMELMGSLGGDVVGGLVAEAGVLGAVKVGELDALGEGFKVWTSDLLGASRTFLFLDYRY